MKISPKIPVFLQHIPFFPFQIFPKQKDAEFDSEGRPFHTFFYTTRPNFTQMLYDVVDTLENCLFFNDRMQSQVWGGGMGRVGGFSFWTMLRQLLKHRWNLDIQ